MTSLPDSARAVLESPALAHLVTMNPDGSPQVSIVWVGLDGDEIVAGHLPEHRKVRNIRHDSRVALSIETGQHNAIGLTEYLVIYGTARITEGVPPNFSKNSHTPTSAPVSASRPRTTRPPGSSRTSGSTVSPGSVPGRHRIDNKAHGPQPRSPGHEPSGQPLDRLEPAP
jgi:PPOX class probable F420-dependent enzyme